MPENDLGVHARGRADGPIGVYDSGLGGLSVVAQIRALMPCEDIVYYADTARVPYGDRPSAHIRRFAGEITRLLVAEGAKAVVAACNTSSALALDVVEAAAGGRPVVGVIVPGARAAVSVSRCGVIGVIATAGTVRSGAYGREVRSLVPSATVVEVACPELVPLVEEGRVEGRDVEELLCRYLAPILTAGADTLVLGCTHYAFLRTALQAALSRLGAATTTVVDPAFETARVVRLRMLRAAVGRPDGAQGRGWVRFIVSGDPERFAALARVVMGGRLSIDSVKHLVAGEDPWRVSVADSEGS